MNEDSRISVLEEKMEALNTRLIKVESRDEEYMKVSTLMEMQIKQNDKQAQQLSDQHETLIKMHENLTGLNNVYNNLDKRVGTLENYNNDKKIDLGTFTRDIIVKIIPSVLGTLLATWLILHFIK